MKISLITVCWNGSKTLRTALESVLSQVGADIDYHVVDGGSTDGTVELIRSYEPKFREKRIAFTWTSERDRGMYDAINKGIERATGEVVGILNADDALNTDDVLAQVVRGFEAAGEGLHCLYGNIRFVRPAEGADLSLAELRRLRTHRVCFARWWKPWMLQWGYMPPHPAIFIRRGCFKLWGGYVPDRNDYRIAADYELLIRYYRVHRMKARYMKVCTTLMRMGGMSTQNVEARRRLNREIIKANRTNGYFCAWPMLLPKYAVKIWEVVLPQLGFIK